ncbi:hypothetical protein F379_099 [Campylobacter phage F379]|uniref:Uncharacterized protein n=1 Tax=Campylobacter phage F379 TaxID=2776767 RepID=A0A7L8ZK02_9CAUD|nr:hypothetical protein F379_099 [Campylobacter phage F379]
MIVITTIEPDLKDVNTTNKIFTRYFEKEAIYCFKCLRDYFDGNIYCLNLNKCDISNQTKYYFEKLNINYIHSFDDRIKNHKCGFWNIPLSGIYFESMFQDINPVMLRIDLDMMLLRALPDLDNFKTPAVSPHTQGSHKYLESKKGVLYNTGIMISKPSDEFYKKQYQLLNQFDKLLNYKECGKLYELNITKNPSLNSLEYPLLEELCVNYIEGVNKLEIGSIEGDEYEAIQDAYFYHCHYEPEKSQNKLKILIQYSKKYNLSKHIKDYINEQIQHSR